MENNRQIVYRVEVGGAKESSEGFKETADEIVGLRDQLAALKEEPLEVAPEVKPPEEK